MRIELYRPDHPESVVAEARWADGRPTVEIHDEEIRRTGLRLFRAVPVVAEDPSLLPAGASGAVVLQPGSLEWFRAAAITRSAEEGLAARIVPEATGVGGWDPAAAYRTFPQAVARLVSAQPAPPQPGETEPEEAAAALSDTRHPSEPPNR